MLKFLRKKETAKKIWITLAMLMLPAFLFWGFGSAFRTNKESQYAGKLFGRNIPINEFKSALLAVRNQAVIQYGEKFREIRKFLDLEAQAWDRLILLHEATRRKIRVSDDEVVKLITSYSFFKLDGQFDKRMYKEALNEYLKTPERIFEEEMRQSLMIKKLFEDVTSGIRATDEETMREYAIANQEISLNYIKASAQDFSNLPAPSEEEVKKFYHDNRNLFEEPATYNIEYVSSDSQEKIIQAQAFLKEDSTKEKISALGLEVKETGFFPQGGPIPGIGWSPQILEIISGLKIGHYYPKPIELDKYYFILKLKDKKDAFTPAFEGIKDKAKEAFLKARSEKMAKDKMDNCLKAAKEAYKNNPDKPLDFSKLAKSFELKNDSTAVFKSGGYLEAIGPTDILSRKAHVLKENEPSDIIQMPSGLYIIAVKSRSKIDEKKFKEEKEKFTETLLWQRKEEAFTDFFQELKSKAAK